MMLFKLSVLCVAIFFSSTLFSIQNEKRGKGKIYFRNESLREALGKIASESGSNFVYSDKLIENIFINCEVEKEPEKALGKILSKTGISYKLFGEKTFVLFKEKKKLPKPKPVKPIVVQKSIAEIDSGFVIQKAILISKEEMSYPIEAVNKNIEGKVRVRFLINTFGDVEKVFMETSSGSSILDSATVKYARNLKFLPAQAKGQSINIWMLMSFEYFCEKN